MKKRNYQTPEIVSIRVNSAPLLSGSNLNVNSEQGDGNQYSKEYSFGDSEE